MLSRQTTTWVVCCRSHRMQWVSRKQQRRSCQSLCHVFSGECLVPRSSHAAAISNRQTCKFPENRLMVNRQHYSIIAWFGLASVAKKMLAVPTTSVASERLFSKAGDVISEKRNRLSASKADQLCFLMENMLVTSHVFHKKAELIGLSLRFTVNTLFPFVFSYLHLRSCFTIDFSYKFYWL